MSIAAMARVWGCQDVGGGSELLALLALADWSDDEGRCWPSMESIAKKTRLSRSQAQRVVHQLIEDGFLEVTGNETGGAPGSTRQYRINLDKLTGSTHATGSAGATGRIHAQEGSHGCGETGRMDATQTVIEPSGTTNTREQARSSSAKGKRKGGISLATFLDNCQSTGEPAIPESDPIYQYAEKVGISDEMLTACWVAFKKAHLTTKKTQIDWRAHFRNAVRLNWYHLWFIKGDDQAEWTTAGIQAKRESA